MDERWRAEGEFHCQTAGTKSFVRGIVNPLNSCEIWPGYATLSIIGDDMEFRDKDWEAKILAAREKSLIVFGDENPTCTGKGNHVFFDARIPAALGYIAPPNLQHLFTDDFYQELGRRLGSLAYVDAGLYHNHPALGRRPWDALTRELNQPEMYERDRKAFRRWCAMEMPAALAKIKEAVK